mgnify:CR=1 FL=1
MNDETVATRQPLSEWHLEMLSPNAAKLYQTIWARMARKNLTTIVLDDAEASRRARVLMHHIPAAQSELARANLLEMSPGVGLTKYTFVSDPGNESIEAE